MKNGFFIFIFKLVANVLMQTGFLHANLDYVMFSIHMNKNSYVLHLNNRRIFRSLFEKKGNLSSISIMFV